MHQLILEDDGFPHLYEKMKQIRMKIEQIDYENYQGVKLARSKFS